MTACNGVAEEIHAQQPEARGSGEADQQIEAEAAA
jgi:hypothetical protein